MRCVLRELWDEDLAVLFEQWADPVAVHMAAFTAADHMDRRAFERRWTRLRADETVINRVIVVDGEVAGTIGSWGDRVDREVTYWIGPSF
jgi:Acetyltransferase (GNAT) domain